MLYAFFPMTINDQKVKVAPVFIFGGSESMGDIILAFAILCIVDNNSLFFEHF